SKYRDLWQPVTFPKLKPVEGDVDERALLTSTAKYIKGQKLNFPERVLNAFHTALKISDISPLVVLAGISGTGKSELPRRYAEGMGIHPVLLAVQPRWDSPQDLFGFYNYLESRYKATELARAMVQFELYNRPSWPLPDDWDYSRSDRMLLVLLDEMNLACVEYYFSEFLSRLETRRGINLDNNEERAKAEIALEMGSLHKGEKFIRLFPGHNILFSGTMNEDETTQALSDKVLDRACVMRFGRPKQLSEQDDTPRTIPNENGLTFDQWKSFHRSTLSAHERGQVNHWINGLNDAMEQINRPFGHRVAQAIHAYVANYPDWVQNRIHLAMADQIEQRIMPKLRGVEVADVDRPLRQIQKVIEECEDQLLLNAFKQGADSQQQIFIWRGLDRAEE
ncbi:MAG: AAA family ATPase, partial [Sedimentisphaerales bacterium]|nr:AAA family ATPase [Sedimentisphaerales bacterium]